jgi:hypothetical protein
MSWASPRPSRSRRWCRPGSRERRRPQVVVPPNAAAVSGHASCARPNARPSSSELGATSSASPSSTIGLLMRRGSCCINVSRYRGSAVAGLSASGLALGLRHENSAVAPPARAASEASSSAVNGRLKKSRASKAIRRRSSQPRARLQVVQPRFSYRTAPVSLIYCLCARRSTWPRRASAGASAAIGRSREKSSGSIPEGQTDTYCATFPRTQSPYVHACGSCDR